MSIKFTRQQIEQAHNVNIPELIRNRGGIVKSSGSGAEWITGTQKVSIKDNLWFNHYEQVGGDAISFVQRYMDMSFVEAVNYLVGDSLSIPDCFPLPNKDTAEQKPITALSLPARNDSMKRVYAYLIKDRKLEKSVVDSFVRAKMIYESDPYHNVVFVGFDACGTPRHAHIRSTYSSYKGSVSGSDNKFSFHWHGQSEVLFLFEAPIDMLSYISMHKRGWQRQSYAACCGVADKVLRQILHDNANIKCVKLCLDNDDAGKKANNRIAEFLKSLDIEYEILIPKEKDWNEDLKIVRSTK